jgi:hypothetical protein
MTLTKKRKVSLSPSSLFLSFSPSSFLLSYPSSLLNCKGQQIKSTYVLVSNKIFFSKTFEVELQTNNIFFFVGLLRDLQLCKFKNFLLVLFLVLESIPQTVKISIRIMIVFYFCIILNIILNFFFFLHLFFCIYFCFFIFSAGTNAANCGDKQKEHHKGCRKILSLRNFLTGQVARSPKMESGFLQV